MALCGLPCVRATVTDYNPNFVSGSQDPAHHLFRRTERDVEVLTLNLNSGTMRVRFVSTDHEGKQKTRTEDISIDAFYQEYDIVGIS